MPGCSVTNSLITKFTIVALVPTSASPHDDCIRAACAQRLQPPPKRCGLKLETAPSATLRPSSTLCNPTGSPCYHFFKACTRDYGIASVPSESRPVGCAHSPPRFAPDELLTLYLAHIVTRSRFLALPLFLFSGFVIHVAL